MTLELITRLPEGAPRPTPILFVHGAWHAAWCWDEFFLPYFAQHGYAAHALSLRGHGGSANRERLRWLRAADYVADVAQVAAQLPAPPVIVGHSMGGYVTQKYLERQPAPAAVLLASVPTSGVLGATLRIAARHPLILLKVNVTLSLYPLISSPELVREAFFSADMPAERVHGYFKRMQDESYRNFLDMLFLNLPRPERVRTPLLVLGAGADRIFTPAEVEATGRAYRAPTRLFPGVAHDLMLEAGWQAVADHILAWLRERGL